MGRQKSVCDEEFMTQVAQWPDAETVAFYTEYSPSTVRQRVTALRKAGHTVEYGSALSEPITVDIRPADGMAAIEEPPFMVTHVCTNCGTPYFSDKLEQGICPTCKHIDRKLTVVTEPEEGYDAGYDEAFAQGWNDAMLYFFGETGTEDNKMYRLHRDALLMNEGFDQGWWSGHNSAFVAGYEASQRDAQNSAPFRDADLERELLLDKFPVWNDTWLTMIQVEWLHTWLEVWRGAQP